MSHYCDITAQILILTFIIYATNGFNFSPKPNLVFREPSLKTFMPKIESSYFGFTINLRESSVIIGAPRAQSTQESQRTVNETGAIYKCSLNGTCAPYIFDWNGNVYAENNDYTYDTKIKHNQWLGASIDGGSKDTDKLVVCAPRIIAIVEDNDYAMHGICYWTSDTLSDSPRNVKRISPLVLQDNQVREMNGERYLYHRFGEQGLSVHVTVNNEEILIGAPGIHVWKGSVIRYHAKNIQLHSGISQRDLNRRRVVRQSSMTYVSEVPNPYTWNQVNDSYFGYSVSSGYFDDTQLDKILYIATAPQADDQSGEAYIFDVVKSNYREYTIKKYHTFHGTQFGEYYGYAVLAEDLNGDGLTDVIITAPQYSSMGIVEQGAFYVYINKGKFVFELQAKVISPINERGRFGSSISTLGDINNDGYNDVAIGAPFAENGAVFIYLGSSNGLRLLPTQKLTSVVPVTASWGSHMFGHGLSKGFDIDNNGLNDFAIGAPNAESVYLYRAYPVVKILATINSLSREIKPEQTKFKINICYKISTTSSTILSQDIALRVNVDPQVNRVTLLETGTGEMVFNATATTQDYCRTLETRVRFSSADIFKPIELELHYELINAVPNSEVFCEKCAAVDPAEPKVNVEKVIFSTGCKTDVCIADLYVKSLKLNPTYVLGSSRTIAVTYEVSNSGEPAYLPQINITSSNKMPFAKIPSACDQHDHVLLCDLNRGQPMTIGSRIIMTIIYDTSQIQGSSMTLSATAFSTGKELHPANNIIKDFITLKEFTEIEVIGKPLTPHINLEKVFNTTQIINYYEIKSDGPSRIQELEIVLEIPIAYQEIDHAIPIIDVNNISVQAGYDKHILAVELYQNNPLQLTNTRELLRINNAVIRNGYQTFYHSVKSISFNITTNTDKMNPPGVKRKPREVGEVVLKSDHSQEIQKNDHVIGELIGGCPINRTIIFNCSDTGTIICARAVLKVYNFLPDIPVTVNLTYNVDLTKVNEILIDPLKYFVIVSNVYIVKIGNEDGNSTRITTKIDYNVISKHQMRSTPIWLIILSILGGLVVLGAIAYGMRKAGFFRRKTKEEMDKLIRARRQTASECAAGDDQN